MEWLLLLGVVAMLYAGWVFLVQSMLEQQSADLFNKIHYDLPLGYHAEWRSASQLEIRNPRHPYQVVLTLAAESIPGHKVDDVVKGIRARINTFFARKGISMDCITGLPTQNLSSGDNWVKLGAMTTKNNEIVQMYYFVRNNAMISVSLWSSAEYAELGVAAVQKLADSIAPNSPHNVIDLCSMRHVQPSI